MLTDAFGAALPYVSKLIRASYDTTIKRSDGKDALAMMVSSIILLGVETWPYDVVEALLDRSADVNTRFNGGLTPLIAWSFGVKPPMHPGCVIGPLLLLRRGADIDARMDDGTTCAHAIASEGNAHLAAALADGGWLAAADLTLLNNAGETALQVAQRELAFTFDDGDRQLIHDSLRDHAMLWTAKARPLIHRWLSHSLFIPDLAHMVLSFVDSKERGQ
jgi:ankyrin repeat protein